jgi:hypothetical protein
MATTQKRVINIGNRPNDGTGDSIRDAFRKSNENFDTLFNVAGLGTGISFVGLNDTPSALQPNKLLITDPTGLTVTQASLVAGTGIQIDTSVNGVISIINSASSLLTDPSPTLSANLDGNVFRATNFGDPSSDQDLVTRQFLYDNFLNRDGDLLYDSGAVPNGSTLRKNVSSSATPTNSTHLITKGYADTKLSRAGTSTIDPATGQINTASGVMTGELRLFRDPIDADHPFIAATKQYVDNNGYYSPTNLYVSKKGRDFQPEVPAYKRGKFFQYAFATLNRAAQYAEQIIATSKIQIGDYARLLTYNDGVSCLVDSVTSNIPISTLVIDAGPNGSDQFGVPETQNNGEYTIFPGQYIQGVESNAIALIEGIDKGEGINAGKEVYTVSYVDYASTFANPIKVTNVSGTSVTFKLLDPEMVPIPDFWIGYTVKYYVSNTLLKGIITSHDSQADITGTYYDYFTIEAVDGIPSLDTEIDSEDWYVYSGDFLPGEEIVYNTNVSDTQISFMIESGEYYEQYPIKLPANTSIRGDEFRRVIFRPKRGISSSPWANTYFRRDPQIDGLQAVTINTAVDYATSGTLATATLTPGSTEGEATFVLSTGSLLSSYKGFMVKIDPIGQGIITSVSSGSFSVNIGTPLASTNPLTPGNWHIYEPVTFGRHYLKNPLKSMNVLTTITNRGGLVNAAQLITNNKKFIQKEVVAWFTASINANLLNPSSIWYGFNNNSDQCYGYVGTAVDGLVNDILEGGSGDTITTADFIANLDSAKPGGTFGISTCSLAIPYINSLTQKIIRNQSITPTAGNNIPQFIDPSIVAEVTTASLVINDLSQASYRIINADPEYNPPIANSEMDVFLCNDANVIRYVSCQNHGGFMMVLDPEGQVKNKSPYAQTNSSFSQSIARRRLAGGMFVDGFTGNILAQPTTSTYVNTDPLTVTVKGLVRKPQVPTFFVYNGIRYEVNFINNFAVDPANTSTYTASLKLNALKPGGIPTPVTMTNGGSANRFKANSTIPVTVSPPSGVGGIPARATATISSTGTVTRINITFPGTGYTATPSFTIGGAIINNIQVTNGVITGASIAFGGEGYTTTTGFTITPIGSQTASVATGSITAVDAVTGAIQAISINSGTGWSDDTAYVVSFGNAVVNTAAATPIPGFIDTVSTDPLTGLPTKFELITAGNRSMLANDFTQVNDLGYGIFVTNGGFAENVSMFTYYCHRSYYSLNGAQIRSTTGSSCYGDWGLVAEGSDPNEVPVPATLAYGMSQIATAYVPTAFSAVAGQNTIDVVVDLNNNGYPPLSSSQIEINHNGTIKTYKIGAASPIFDSQSNPVYLNGDASKPIYTLSFNTGGVSASSQTGLYATVTDGTPITIRQVNRFKFYGFDPDSFSRSSTSIKMNDDIASSYHITTTTKNTNDNSVDVDILEDYNYITTVAVQQGLTYPILTNGGSGYTTATITVNTGTLADNNTATVVGNQGSDAPIDVVTVNSVSGIRVGQLITSIASNSIQTGTAVTFVNTVTSQIGISLQNASTVADGTVLRFNAVQPTIVPTISTGTITDLTVVNGGAGWNSTTTTISISGNGASAAITSPINLAGVVGSNIIKIAALSDPQRTRILAGLTASPQYYYQFGLNGQLFNIVNYRPTSVTGQEWEEIVLDVPLTTPVAQNTAIKIGVPRSTGAEITTRISLLRVTGHDFVDIGTGGYATTRIPNDLYGPPVIAPDQAKEVQEIGAARVYYATTDQDGNFRVGSVFRVNQARGTVSINAPIDLTNLSSISLKKNQGPAVDEFSLDDRMAGDIGGYHNRIPTEKTIVTYINRRLGVDQRGLIYTGGTIGGGMLALNGTTPMKGALNMDGFAVSGLPTAPSNSDEAAPKGYVDSRLHRSGTSAVDTNGTTRRDDWGVMLGPLQLSGEPVVYTTATTAQVNIGTSVIPIGLSYGYYRGLGVSGHPNIATGTVVSSVQSLNSIVLSIPALGTIPSGTVLTLDPVSQAVNKSYADKKSQFNQLRDVVLTNTTDTDFLMFSNTTIAPQAASGTTAAVYNTATAIVNVKNNTGIITNSTNSNGGGSDISVVRTNNTVTFKLVGGQGANNPITDHHINNSAAIAQSKLSMKKADTSASSSGLQSDLGLAQFNNVEFSATNGWVSLLSSTNTTTGIAPSKLQQVSGATGGFLGRTSAGAVDYQTSGTIRTWLQVLGLEGGALNGNLTVSGNAGIGTISPETLLHVAGTSTTAIARIQNTGVGATTFNGSGSGLELLANGMNTTSKYTPAIKFGSTDAQFTSTNPKFGAAIIAEAIQTYSLDTTGGMDLSFWTSPASPGPGSGLVERVRIDSAGNVGIGLVNPLSRLHVSGDTIITGSLSIGNGLTVDGSTTFNDAVTFARPVTFNGTATYVMSTNTVFTDNIIALHTPPGGVDSVWSVNDGKDIGIRFHYFNSGDQKAALIMDSTTRSLDWYQTSSENTSGIINTGTLGTFRTGAIKLEGGTNSSNTTTGDLTVIGGVGIGRNMYVGGDIFMAGSKVITESTVPASGVSSFSAGTTGFTPNSATTGSITLSGVLNPANGGTGVAGTITGIAYANGASDYTAATAAQVTATIGATYVQNANFATVAGSLSGGTIAITNGGTGETTRQAAMNALAGAVTNNQYLQGNGTNVVMAALAAGDLTGTIPSGVLGNSNVFIGTTSVALNRASASLSLTGVSIDGSAGSVTGGVYTTGDQTIGGTKTFSGQIRVSNGTAAAPSIAFSGDTGVDTGFYWGGDGIIKFTNNGVDAGEISGGNLTMVGDITAFSDARLKTDLEQIPNAISKVQELTGYTYTRVDTGKRQTGIIAQDLQKVLPEAVIEGDEYMSVAYGNLVGLLVEAIKELKAEIEELKGNK